MAKRKGRGQSGFSLPEILVVVLILSIVTAAIFGIINQAQQRYIREVKVMDVFGQARSAMEQMVSEIHQAGYPAINLYALSAKNPSNLALTVATAIGSEANNNKVASTFLLCPSAGGNDIVFEADLNDDGIVERVQYQLQGRVLMRSAVPKSADGAVPSAVFIPLVEGVINNAVPPLAAAVPIFICSPAAGSLLPAPRNTGSVSIRLIVESAQADPQTRVQPRVTLTGFSKRLNPDN